MEKDAIKEVLVNLLENIKDEEKLNYFNSQITTIKEIIETMVKKPVNSPVDIQLASKLVRIYLDLPRIKATISYAPMYSQIAKYGLSVSTVCSLAGVNTTIRKQIKADKPVNIENLLRIADVLGCKVSDLYEEIDENEQQRRLEKKKSFGRSHQLYDLAHLVYLDSDEEVELENSISEQGPKTIKNDYRIETKHADIEVIRAFYINEDLDD